MEILILLCALLSIANGQFEVYSINVKTKTPAHPYYNIGDSIGFEISGTEGPTLALLRGRTYAFFYDVMENCDVPFNFAASENIGESPFVSGVNGSGMICPGNSLFFTPDNSAPPYLWYQSFVKDRVGGKVYILSSATSSTEFDFIVEVKNKTPSHPFYGNGSSIGFTINGTEGMPLSLDRNRTYRFWVATPDCKYPFNLATSPNGGQGTILQGVLNSFACQGMVLEFTPNQNTPNVIYYQTADPYQNSMGGSVSVYPPLNTGTTSTSTSTGTTGSTGSTTGSPTTGTSSTTGEASSSPSPQPSTSTSSAPATTTETTGETTGQQDNHKGGSDDGKIAGIIIGVILGVAFCLLLILLVICFQRRRQSKRKLKDDDDDDFNKLELPTMGNRSAPTSEKEDS